MFTGGRYGVDLSFTADADLTINRILVATTEGHCNLPSGDDPLPDLVLGIGLEGRNSGQVEQTRVKGMEAVELAGTATVGEYARVMNGGQVQNITNNGGSPVAQTVCGVFRTAGANGEYPGVELADVAFSVSR